MSRTVTPENVIPSGEPEKPSDERNPAEISAPLQESSQNSKENGIYLSDLLDTTDFHRSTIAILWIFSCDRSCAEHRCQKKKQIICRPNVSSFNNWIRLHILRMNQRCKQTMYTCVH